MEEKDADLYNAYVEPFSPTGSTDKNLCASLSNAISLVNRYCAKLPSDTFTKLTPIWSMSKSILDDGTTLYSCTVRLPINSPVKQSITVIFSFEFNFNMFLTMLLAVVVCICNSFYNMS